MARIATSLLLVLLVLTLALTGCGSSARTEGGATAPATGTTAESESEAVELPPGPADISGMQAWLEKAYPDADWLGRIKKIEHVPGEVPDSGGFSNAIVVTTDLDFGSEQAAGEAIRNALGEAHVTWAKQYVIKFADGNNVMAGDIVDMTP